MKFELVTLERGLNLPDDQYYRCAIRHILRVIVGFHVRQVFLFMEPRQDDDNTSTLSTMFLIL